MISATHHFAVSNGITQMGGSAISYCVNRLFVTNAHLTTGGYYEDVVASFWEMISSAGATVEWYSWYFLEISHTPVGQLVVSGESRCSIIFSWLPVGGANIAGITLLQLHLIFLILPLVIVDGTAGNPLNYDVTLVVGSDSDHGYSNVVEGGSIVSTHMMLQAGQIIIRVGGTRRIPVCYLVIPSSGALIWGASAATYQDYYV